MWAAIAERRAGRRPFWRQVSLIRLGLAACLGLVLIGAFGLRRPLAPDSTAMNQSAAPLLQKDGSRWAGLEVSSASPAAFIEFNDGSHITALPDTKLESLESTSKLFVIALQRGEARFEVTPGGPRRWQIEAGIARVEVVGTRFSVSREPEKVSVRVDHGVVLVRAATVPGGAIRLEAGKSLDVLSTRVAQLDPVQGPRPSASPAEGNARVPPSTEPTTPRDSAWREATRSGRHAAAYAALGDLGFQREVARTSGLGELFALADMARLSGHPEQAVLPLEAILQRQSAGSSAALAAMTLGKIELERARPREAARAFERALAAGAPSTLREDVFVRLVQAYVRAGDRSSAERAAARYAALFPEGRHRAEVERWLSR
jgi:transmembrane sensor